jgi:hypothetical protein
MEQFVSIPEEPVLKRLIFQLTLVLALIVGANLPANAQSNPGATTTPPGPPSVGAASEVIVHGKIVAVNKSSKLVTIAGPEGNQIVLRVENHYNLKAAKVGDPVVAHFYEIVTIRKKKPGETVPAASLKEGIVSAQPGQTPGGAAAQQLELSVKVISIDKAHETVTIAGPDGNPETVKARDPRNLDKIKPGDELVVKVTRAIAIRIDKV